MLADNRYNLNPTYITENDRKRMQQSGSTLNDYQVNVIDNQNNNSEQLINNNDIKV